jgi:hypothetical protein
MNPYFNRKYSMGKKLEIDVNSKWTWLKAILILVPYSRKSVTQFSPHALRGIKNKKSGGYYKIRMLK